MALLTKLDLSVFWSLIGGSLLLFLLISIIQLIRNPLWNVPGPWHTRFTRLELKIRNWRGNRIEYLDELHREYGPIVRLGPNEVSVTDLPTAKQIHRVQSKFLKTDFYPRLTAGFWNVFSMRSPKAHSERRRLLATPLSETGLKKFQDIVATNVKLTIENIGKDVESQGESNVFKWFFFMATDVIGQLTFGESFKLLEKGYETQYVKDLQNVSAVDHVSTELPRILQAAFMITSKGQEIIKWNKRMTRYGNESLQRYKDLVEKNGDAVVPTLFTRLYKGEEAGSLTQRDMAGEARAYLVAGTDTTAATMTNVALQLARSPEIQSALRTAYANLSPDPSWDELKEVRYAENLIKEVLRLYGPANGLLPRRVPQEGVRVGSFYIPGDTVISCSGHLLHQRPEIFEEPERCIPERWDKPTQEMKDAWIAFGGGSRVCIGMHLAMNELRLATFHLMKQFPKGICLGESFDEDDVIQRGLFLVAPKGHRCMLSAK